MKLYELRQGYAQLQAMLESEEAVADQAIKDTLDGITAQAEEKLDSIACVIAGIEAEEAATRAESNRLRQRAVHMENQAARLKKYALDSMIGMGISRAKGVRFSLAVGTATRVRITSPESLPEKYLVTKVEISKAAVGDDLKAGVVVPGAELEQSSFLRIT